MNAKIKKILKKHGLSDLGDNMTNNLNNVIIEICEEQMKADKIRVEKWFDGYNEITYKNIANEKR
jgi:hypothetical protein